MLNRAREIRDLKVPPGNRLEVLKGNRKRQHSIRINNKWSNMFSMEWDRHIECRNSRLSLRE